MRRYADRDLIWSSDDEFLLVVNSDLRDAIRVNAGLVAVNMFGGKPPFLGALVDNERSGRQACMEGQ